MKKRILAYAVIILSVVYFYSSESLADGPRPLIDRIEIKPLESIYGIHLIQYETTHRRNFIIDLDDQSMIYVGDGDIEFEPNGNIINRWKKSYFNKGGAFWYDLMRDPKGNPIAVLDMPNATDCYEGDDLKKFHESITKLLSQQNKDKFCVWQK
jgi:hypothetical protein